MGGKRIMIRKAQKPKKKLIWREGLRVVSFPALFFPLGLYSKASLAGSLGWVRKSVDPTYLAS